MWQDAIEKAPNNARAMYNLGNVYLKAGLFNKALSLYVRSEQLSDTAPLPRIAQSAAINGVGSVYLLTDRPEQAIPFFKKTLNLDPSYNLARFNMTLALLSLQKWQEAQDNVELLLKSDKNNADYHYLYNIIILNKEIDVTAPMQLLGDLTDLSPTNANLRLLMAITYKNSGNYKEALKYLNAYDSIMSRNMSSKLAFLDIYTRQNNIPAKNRLVSEIVTNFSVQEIETGLSSPIIMGMEIFSADKLRKIINGYAESTTSMHQ